MFKLLAIRPLEGCAQHIQKCLKTGMMYYFCNDYIIEPGSHIRRRSKNIKPLKEDFFSLPNTTDDTREDGTKTKSPTVSVSAIVGKNGDGKSTLVELMMRLINNCAKSYNLCASQNDLRRVKDVKAELYYMVDNVVYRIAEEKDDEKDDDGTQIWKVAELKLSDEKGEKLMRWKIEPELVNSVDDDPKCFFFTIVSNYSHFAYNIHDFKREWDEHGDEKSDDEKCWLHYIFHKNDGYLTPITLHPFRKEGNIDINIEKSLSKQRLLSLFLNADNPTDNPNSFRRVNGKDANVLKLTEITESKLQQKAILEYFNATINKSKFDMVLKEIDSVDEEIVHMVSLSGSGIMKKYERLAEFVLPSNFVDPIYQIIEQDADFSDFAKNIISWLNKSYNYGDIRSVINRYNILNDKIKGCAEIIYYNKSASEYMKVGDFERAWIHCQMAINIMNRTRLSKDLLLIASCYNNLGMIYEVYDVRSDYNEALECYLKSLSVTEKFLGQEHSDTAISYNNIGGVYMKQGNYGKAMEYYLKALEIREKVLGKEHSDTATSYYNIGLVYERQGDYGKALEYHFKAMEIREKVLGKEHPETAASYHNIGVLYFIQGDSDKAKEYFQKENLSDKNDKSLRNEEIQKETEEIQKERDEIIRILNTHKNLIKSKHKFLYKINATMLGRLDTLYRIMKSYNYDWRIVTKEYSELSLKEKCQHYVIYKVWSILATYQNVIDFNKDRINPLREYGNAMQDYIYDVFTEYTYRQTHLTLELRQLEHFMGEGLQDGGIYKRLDTKQEAGKLSVEIDKLKEHYEGNSFSLDNLPPPLYKWDISFNRKDNPTNCDIELDSFSSGEKQLLSSMSSIIYHLQNLANDSSLINTKIKYNNVNLIMEEIELYYHPEYQRQFFSRLLDLIKRAELSNIQNINIIFVTHSPFILSDIPKCNVLFLKEGMPDDELQENTFGANIHSLLKHGFFMPNLPIGEFAYRKINALFKKLNTGDFTNDDEEKRKEELAAIYQQILLVGEPFLRNQLLLLFNAFKGSKIIPTNL